MAMEVEYVDMGSEDIGEVADMAAADIVNGAGEVVVERDYVPSVTITQLDGDGNQIDTKIRVEDGVEVQLPVNEEMTASVSGVDVSQDGLTMSATLNFKPNEWVEHSPESQTATAENPPLVDELSEEQMAAEVQAFHNRVSAVQERWKAEWEHEKEIATAKEAHTAASLARQAAEEVFKAAKATEKACLSELSALINRGPDYPKPVDSSSINQGGDASDPIAAAVRNDKDSRPIPVDDPNADQSWRSIPTSEILDGIKGMGDKKRDAILSLIPTMGDLEDLRGQASIAHKPFRSVLPKGVGETMADEIEERAVVRMRKHQLDLDFAKSVNQMVEDPVEIEVEVEVEYEDADQTEPEATTLVESAIDIDDV